MYCDQPQKSPAPEQEGDACSESSTVEDTTSKKQKKKKRKSKGKVCVLVVVIDSNIFMFYVQKSRNGTEGQDNSVDSLSEEDTPKAAGIGRKGSNMSYVYST